MTDVPEPGKAAKGELFELELFGGAIERRYRRMRPEVEEMPWGTIDVTGIPERDLLGARKAWTGAAFQEHRTGVACAVTLQALIEARAPLDLIAMATRFPLDEMVHVELCARMAMELGGGTEIVHDPDHLVLHGDPSVSPLTRAAELVTRFFCVGEALSIPLLRGTWKAAKHPLPRAVLGRIVKDEAAHGTFGFSFLDWALPQLTEAEIAHVGRHADLAIAFIVRQWVGLRKRKPRKAGPGDALAWMESEPYLALAEKSMREKVVEPLRSRGLAISAY
ncbi:MAG: ferritin-like domain-containing protein [Polyangiaceae bacterium]